MLSGVFVWHALRVERPLLDVRLYANRVFAAASLTTFGLGAALFGAMILVPLYYQEVRHESVIVTGLLVGPQGLGMLLVMPLTGRLTAALRRRPRRAGRRARSSRWARSRWRSSARARRSCYISLVLLLRGVGIGLSFMPAMTAAFSSLRPDQLSDATPQLNVLQRIGGAIGTAVLAVVLQRASGTRAGQARERLRHRLLVVAGDRRALADPLRRAAARREPACAPEPRGGQRRGGRRAAGRVSDAMATAGAAKPKRTSEPAVRGEAARPAQPAS